MKQSLDNAMIVLSPYCHYMYPHNLNYDLATLMHWITISRAANLRLSRFSQITRFMGPTWGPPGSCRPQMGPCWSHEPCYQGFLLQLNALITHRVHSQYLSVIFLQITCDRNIITRVLGKIWGVFMSSKFGQSFNFVVVVLCATTTNSTTIYCESMIPWYCIEHCGD